MKKGKNKTKDPDALYLKDKAASYGPEVEETSMIRTQIYLTRSEHEFLQSESARRGEPMAAVIRGFIDERMILPDEAWTKNPLLEPTVEDPEFEGHEDGSLNHEHYAYGAPRKYEKREGKWVLLPAVDE